MAPAPLLIAIVCLSLAACCPAPQTSAAQTTSTDAAAATETAFVGEIVSVDARGVLQLHVSSRARPGRNDEVRALLSDETIILSATGAPLMVGGLEPGQRLWLRGTLSGRGVEVSEARRL